MRQFVRVNLWNEPLGVMARDSETHLEQFEFFPSFLRLGWEISPILFPMERLRLKPEIYQFKEMGGLPNFLADILPGNYARDILRYALHDSQQTPETLSSQSYLSLLGNRGMGAFSFEPSGYPELNASETIDFDLLVKYAYNLFNNNGNGLSDRRVRELLRSGLFTRGSRPKALVAINDFTGEVVSGQGAIPEGFESWIIKLDGVRMDCPDDLMVEYDYYKKAIACGITMAPCRMLKDGHKTHLLCKRFDRVENERLHIQSFAALREDPEDSYEAAFRCMRQMHLSHFEMEELYRRMVFNILIGNKKVRPDKILFTFSRTEKWKLAPAFNLKPTPNEHVHALSVCGKMQDITKENLLDLGKKLNIKQAKSILKSCSEVLEK
ncbi:MAG: type II toxin-antitoxin system HipA family toxin [Bacteroidales bacterium]|nr:type II toxin-antitoxin system HipA family toxin [Bacteroidales bacterium]